MVERRVHRGSAAREASKHVLWTSPDGRFESGIWACTPGSFNLEGMDETVCLVEGVVEITPHGGDTVTLRPGDAAFFPAGLPCRWEVKETIRKAYNLAVPTD